MQLSSNLQDHRVTSVEKYSDAQISAEGRNERPWLIGKDLASDSAVSEKGGIQTDEDIPICSDLGSSDLNKAIGRHLVFCLTKYQLQLGSSDLSIGSSAQAGPSTSRPEHSRNILK
ncbi:hypothetical protein Taro_012540 [Colocasia esculenta]|uniref:Uncharacterized protein n=1 Tax=Colocasia esculenta TaxID=4460 RepID=A0A843UDU7_COLES|nr:hypothetical protein [Colocasia esculenta]